MKKTAIFLCVALALPLALISCGEGGATSAATSAQSETLTTTAETKLSPDIPELDLKGEKINFLVRGKEAQPTNYSVEIFSAELNGEPINDAVFNRNKTVESKYNFTVTETAADDTVDKVRQSVMANDGSYSVVMVRPERIRTAALDGLLLNLYDAPYVDLSKPWWDSRLVDALTYNKKLYFAAGDINIMDNNSTWVVLFNRDLFDSNGLDYPYKAVRDGSWTYDSLGGYIKKGTKDLNGDGKLDETDAWGLVADQDTVYSMAVAGGERLTEISGDTVKYVLNIDTLSGKLDKITKLTSDKSTTLLANDYTSKYGNPWAEVNRVAFRDGRGLMYITGILSATYLRDMENEFGIVPIPKASETQNGYHSWVQLNNSSTLGIPSGRSDYTSTGAAVEALAAESMYTLTPAYFDTTLSGKVTRDDDSDEMLSIVLSSTSFDLGNIYNFGGISTLFSSLYKGDKEIASSFAAIESKVSVSITEFIEKYAALK